MKLNLPILGKSNQRLLFSNVNMEDPNEFYLLMTFHRNRKGGFHYPVTVEECQKALSKKKKEYKFVKPLWI